MLNKVGYIKNSIRHFSSALYITGDKAQKNFVVLTPVIDFENQLKNKTELVENIKTRQLSIDLDKVEERWNFYKEVDQKKDILDQTRSEIGQAIANLMKLEKNVKTNEEIEKLRSHLKIIKEDSKSLRTMSYSVEEAAALQVLGLPNVLHPKTPHKSELEVYSYLEKPEGKSESHITIGEEKNYIKYINHMSCYLKSEAALFEFAVRNYFVSGLIGLNYIQFSNSDFVKSVVVEGCGTDPNNKSEVLTLEDIHCNKSDELSKLHLVGSSSIYSFMAYFAKHYIQTTQFPLKAFCFGRGYRSVEEHSPKNLFNLNQSSEVGVFITALEESNILDNIIEDISMLYKQLGHHFRIVLIPANKLKKAESLRLSVQMISSHSSCYVEVGNVSFYEDFLSKRLLLNYSENKERKYPKVIGGSVINIQKVLGCILESTSVENRPLISEFLYNYVC